MTAIGLIGSVMGVVYLLLKYYPEWRKRDEAKESETEAGAFGRDLVDSNDIGVSVRLSELYDRVRTAKGKDTP